MTEKFKVGDRVYDILRGVGKVIAINSETAQECYFVEVLFELRQYSGTYSQKGFWDNSYLNPTLFTLAEARAKGYDVPKEMVKKTIKRWVIVNTKTGWSALAYTPPKVDDNCIVKEVVFEWEEEV